MRGAANRSRQRNIHVTGAEGIYEENEIMKIISKYVLRAMNHPKGPAETINITVERLSLKPKAIAALPVKTVSRSCPEEAGRLAAAVLREVGVSGAAIKAALRVLRSPKTMRGAAFVAADTGRRLEPDGERGVRASRMGIEKTALNTLKRTLRHSKIDSETVIEALVLASKVASCKGVLAELCISDDPDYTTGYVASKSFGYMRIPNIKKGGSQQGGRAFFVKKGAEINKIIQYLETTPVMITEIPDSDTRLKAKRPRRKIQCASPL